MEDGIWRMEDGGWGGWRERHINREKEKESVDMGGKGDGRLEMCFFLSARVCHLPHGISRNCSKLMFTGFITMRRAAKT